MSNRSGYQVPYRVKRTPGPGNAPRHGRRLKYEDEMSAWLRRNVLFQWRAAKGLSQTEVAHCLQASLRSVNSWERGVARPRPVCMNRIGELIGKKQMELEKWWDDWFRDRPPHPESILPNGVVKPVERWTE